MRKRIALLLTMTLIGSAVLFACGGASVVLADSSAGELDFDPTDTSISGEVLWEGWTPGSPLNEQYIEEFNKVYPNIKVTWKQVDIDSYDATLKPILANGSDIDIFEVSAGSANGGVSIFGGMAIDMTPYLQAVLGDDYADKLTESAIKYMTVDGEIKGLSVASGYAGNLWINKDLFDKYDVAIPTNMEEWKQAVETFEANGIIGFVQGAGQGAFNMDTWHAICDNVEPGMFTKACRGEVEWTDETFIKALDLWKSLFDEGIMQEGALGIQQYPEANNLFMSQKAAMVMMGSWYTQNTLPNTMRAAMEAASCTDDPFTMIPIDFPDIAGTGNVGAMFNDIDYANAVAASSENIPAAVAFALWLGASEDGQQIITDTLSNIPVLKSVSPNWDAVVLVNPEAQNEAIQNYLANAMDNGDNPRFGDISADMNQAMQDVLAGVGSGTMSSEEAAEYLAEVQAGW